MKLKTTEFYNWKVFFVAAVFGTFSKDVFAEKVSPIKSSSASSSSVNRGTSDINHSLGKGIPANVLLEIGSLDDHLKCFPKLLCTIYQDDSITRRGFVNATELGVAYLKLLRAAHYTSPTVPTSTTTTKAPKVKRPIIQVFQIPMGLITSYYSGRKDHPDLLEDLEDEQPYHFRSHEKDTPYYETRNDYEDDGYNLRQDDIDHEYLREKVEISQMMEDLINEDKAEMESSEQPPSFMGSSTAGGSLLSSFLPFLGSRSMGKGGADSERGFRSDDRSKRIATPKTPNTRRSNRRLYRSKPVKKDPFWRVVNIWKKLKHRSQCQQMYPDCPFESWEIVRMLDLVKGQAKVLSAYLKITVDNVKPASMRN